MADRLVILSDMWGIKKGMWITSYLGYLQQYYKIEFYDMMQLANIDPVHYTEEKICAEFMHSGIDTAVAHLLKKESEPSHYLTFCVGGTVAWKAALKGLPIKSLYAVSPGWLQFENEKPNIPMTLLYGEQQPTIPGRNWTHKVGAEIEVVPNFGATLYSDEKIIRKVCLDLLNSVTQHKTTLKKVV
ncbi:MAG: hypothetical protein MUO53_12100 [Maribacter sp.]|nr:hypothetical protein [Maribacter sp.]